MSEVEKMYEKVGIKKQYCGWLDIGDSDTNIQYVRSETKEEYDNYATLDSSDLVQTTPNEEYPPFTAEKQLELIKWLARKDSYSCNYSEIKPRDNNEEWMSYSVFKAGFAHSFEESLAGIVNNIWQDLTEEEQEQIRSILNGN